MTNNCGENSEEGNRGPAAGKTTKGRQKIEIKQLEKKNNLHVTFSKRRNGLFKKASELCVLSGAKIGVLVLSPRPREKPFSFGHPNIEKLLDRYLGENPTDADIEAPASAAAAAPADDVDLERAILRDLPGFEEIHKKFEEALEELDKEKNRGKEMENNDGKFWWDEEIEGMGLEELEIYVNAMEDLKKNVIARVNALTMENVMENYAPADRESGFGFAQNLSRSGGLR